MNRTLRTIFGAGLLALSGSAAAILVNNHHYGISDYRLEDIDLAIEALASQATSKADHKNLKNVYRLDQQLGLLADMLYQAETGGMADNLSEDTRKLVRRETRLLNILAGFLPVDTDSTGPGYIPVIDIPQPEVSEFLPLPREIISPLDSGPISTYDLAGQEPVSGNPAVAAAAVPEPPLPALLGLGLLLMFRLRRKQTP